MNRLCMQISQRIVAEHSFQTYYCKDFQLSVLTQEDFADPATEKIPILANKQKL